MGSRIGLPFNGVMGSRAGELRNRNTMKVPYF